MKTFITITIFLLAACAKSTDYGYLNTDRRPLIILVSERYDNPPATYSDGTWKYHKIVYDTLDRGTDPEAYRNLLDTIPKDWKSAWCSIDKIDSSFLIEIRKYKIH